MRLFRRSRSALPEAIALDHPPVSVRLRQMARARRFTLRLAESGPVLTLPPDCPEPEVRRFLAAHAGWLEAAIARRPAMIEVGPGIALPVDGIPHRIVTLPGRARVSHADGVLTVAGNGAPGPRVAGWLKARARGRLVARAQHHAAKVGRPISGFAFKDTRSRWGSCSTAGRINFCWRLAMAPPEIQDYVAAHEVAHLVEMNHAPQFWALLEEILPGHDRHRQWLRREGPRLRAYRFGTEPGSD